MNRKNKIPERTASTLTFQNKSRTHYGKTKTCGCCFRWPLHSQYAEAKQTLREEVVKGERYKSFNIKQQKPFKTHLCSDPP